MTIHTTLVLSDLHSSPVVEHDDRMEVPLVESVLAALRHVHERHIGPLRLPLSLRELALGLHGHGMLPDLQKLLMRLSVALGHPQGGRGNLSRPVAGALRLQAPRSQR